MKTSLPIELNLDILDLCRLHAFLLLFETFFRDINFLVIVFICWDSRIARSGTFFFFSLRHALDTTEKCILRTE